MQYQGVHSIVPGGSFGISGALVHRLVRMAPGIKQRWLDAKVAGVSRDR